MSKSAGPQARPQARHLNLPGWGLQPAGQLAQQTQNGEEQDREPVRGPDWQGKIKHHNLGLRSIHSNTVSGTESTMFQLLLHKKEWQRMATRSRAPEGIQNRPGLEQASNLPAHFNQD